MPYGKRNIMLFAKVAYESFIAVGFVATKMEIAVQGVHVEPLLLHHEGKCHRICAAAKCDKI